MSRHWLENSFATTQTLLPATWRRRVLPACPCCRRGPVWPFHWDCTRKQTGSLYIDMASGEVHCISCGCGWSFEQSKHYCNCGAVYIGGELWQGMEAELGRMGNVSWLKAAGIQRGNAATTLLGWSHCIACGNKEFTTLGMRRGGICWACWAKAKKRLDARFSLAWRCDTCSWCSQWSWHAVKIGTKRICRHCLDTMGRESMQRPFPL